MGIAVDDFSVVAIDDKGAELDVGESVDAAVDGI